MEDLQESSMRKRAPAFCQAYHLGNAVCWNVVFYSRMPLILRYSMVFDTSSFIYRTTRRLSCYSSLFLAQLHCGLIDSNMGFGRAFLNLSGRLDIPEDH